MIFIQCILTPHCFHRAVSFIVTSPHHTSPLLFRSMCWIISVKITFSFIIIVHLNVHSLLVFHCHISNTPSQQMWSPIVCHMTTRLLYQSRPVIFSSFLTVENCIFQIFLYETRVGFGISLIQWKRKKTPSFTKCSFFWRRNKCL